MYEETASPEAVACNGAVAVVQAEAEARLAAGTARSLAEATLAGSGSPPTEPAEDAVGIASTDLVVRTSSG